MRDWHSLTADFLNIGWFGTNAEVSWLSSPEQFLDTYVGVEYIRYADSSENAGEVQNLAAFHRGGEDVASNVEGTAPAFFPSRPFLADLAFVLAGLVI